ncbi:pimeloyl-ACP methyl ester carboxylesterase [Nonomuraea thailandensis]|uniref:Pimeloyl-ACP methyl ester carboxylesterase n=1 Tax=Nonomuraea thailandensis TaxID=1188745 RepID=A0A9X2K0Q2_9ACTN|nr:alpha/beta hydrolase [Nonomuraea thailandensis]MCP2356138.1 pimeloyl-ACP methyl ester carboxylesterase [Nonomuraea thailandensis]
MTVRPQSRTRSGFSLAVAALTLTLGVSATVTPASAATSAATSAAVTSAGAKPTVVLVHGAFADASGFNELITRLQGAGFPVIAPANPLRDVAGDAAYVSSVLDTIPGPIILVGHSYGGIVITNAARGHDNVKALVYLGAFAPDKGESALKLAGQFPGSELGHALLARDYKLPDGTVAGTDGYITAEKFREVFAADLPAYRTRAMAATQRPGSATGLSDGSGEPAWKNIPSWYLIPTQDKVIPPAAQRFMAKRAGSTVKEIRSSHVVMTSHPDAAAAVVLSAYAATR